MAESANTEFQYIFCPDNEAYLVYLGELVREHADALAAGFYRELMGKPDARVFLDNKLVDTKLRHSMAHWLADLFRPRAADEQLAFVQRQNTIGEVHARIGVSLKLVQQGMRIIKRDLFHRLAIKEQNPERQIAMLLLADDLLDYAGALFNTQYVERVVESEGQIRSLRLHMSTQNLAVEIEALKAGLLDWLRRVLTALNRAWANGVTPDAEPADNSAFSLWLQYKGELIFADHPDLDALYSDQRAIAEVFQRAARSCGSHDKLEFLQHITDLNEVVTKACWHLGELVNHTLEQSNIRDPLTGILNRRFLPYIMRQQIRHCRSHDQSFTVLLLDLDHFKKINDTYGHPVGDAVLTQFAETLQSCIRVSDFIFRYGGEEFLVVLVNTGLDQALIAAEKIRRTVENTPFNVKNDKQLRITLSIGVAQYDGHPDYENLIERADKAVYLAKSNGRNRCEALSAS